MKKLGLVLLGLGVFLLVGCADETNQSVISELQATIETQEARIAELEEQLESTPVTSGSADQDQPWNRWLDTQEEGRMLSHGLTVGQVRDDLMEQIDLVPIEPARYGATIHFNDVYIAEYSVLVYASDGHWEEQLFLSYHVEGDVITWTVIAYTNEGQLHLVGE